MRSRSRRYRTEEDPDPPHSPSGGPGVAPEPDSDRRSAPRLVLFDMDDTLFDHSLTCRAALARLRREEPGLASRPLEGLWKEYLRLLDLISPDANEPAEVHARARAERFRRLAQSCSVELSEAGSLELASRYRRYYQSLRRPVPGAPEFVRSVARWAVVGVVTNNQVAEQEEKLRFLGLEGVVGALTISEAVGVGKPDPRIFRAALASAGVPAEESVMVGDSWANDVEGALGVGIRAIWFNRFGSTPPRPARVPVVRAFHPTAPANAAVGGPRASGRRLARGVISHGR